MYTINNIRSNAIKAILRNERKENLKDLALSVVCGIILAVLCVSFFI